LNVVIGAIFGAMANADVIAGLNWFGRKPFRACTLQIRF
jgi:hypothetical protein